MSPVNATYFGQPTQGEPTCQNPRLDSSPMMHLNPMRDSLQLVHPECPDPSPPFLRPFRPYSPMYSSPYHISSTKPKTRPHSSPKKRYRVLSPLLANISISFDVCSFNHSPPSAARKSLSAPLRQRVNFPSGLRDHTHPLLCAVELEDLERHISLQLTHHLNVNPVLCDESDGQSKEKGARRAPRQKAYTTVALMLSLIDCPKLKCLSFSVDGINAARVLRCCLHSHLAIFL